MVVFDLLMTVSPEISRKYVDLTRFRPRLYLKERSGLRCGIVRFHEWEVIDPDDGYKLLSCGKDPWEALDRCLNK